MNSSTDSIFLITEAPQLTSRSSSIVHVNNHIVDWGLLDAFPCKALIVNVFFFPSFFFGFNLFPSFLVRYFEKRCHNKEAEQKTTKKKPVVI
jgi:hypothetical protein